MLARALVVLLGAALVALVVAGFVTLRLLAEPPETSPRPHLDPTAGVRVQEGFAEVLMRQGGLSHRSEPVVIPAVALNEFLARHLAMGRLPVVGLQVRVGQDQVDVVGRTSLARLSGGPVPRGFASVLPEAILDLDLWVVLRGRVEVRNGQGELIVRNAAIGRQPVPPAWIWRVLGVAPVEVLVWKLPRIVDRIAFEPGRVVIHTRPRAP